MEPITEKPPWIGLVFQLPAALQPTQMTWTPTWKEKEHEDLNILKQKITPYEENHTWEKVKKLSNPYELVYTNEAPFFPPSLALQKPLSRSYFKMIEMLKVDDKKQAFTNIRQLLADNSVKSFADFYTVLFEKVDEYAPNNTAPKIKVAINDAKKINLDLLPQSKKDILNDHFTKSLTAFDLVINAQEKKKILDSYSKDYYDVHAAARKSQTKILDHNKKISEIARWRKPGHFRTCSAASYHRIELDPDIECWTLFMPGIQKREWGFLSKGKWVQHEQYMALKRQEKLVDA